MTNRPQGGSDLVCLHSWSGSHCERIACGVFLLLLSITQIKFCFVGGSVKKRVIAFLLQEKEPFPTDAVNYNSFSSKVNYSTTTFSSNINLLYPFQLTCSKEHRLASKPCGNNKDGQDFLFGWLCKCLCYEIRRGISQGKDNQQEIHGQDLEWHLCWRSWFISNLENCGGSTLRAKERCNLLLLL